MLAHRTTNPLRIVGLVAAAVGSIIAFVALLPVLMAGVAAVPDVISWVIAALASTGRAGLVYLGITVVVGGWAAMARSDEGAWFAGVAGAAGLAAAFVAFWQDWSFFTPFVVAIVLAFAAAVISAAIADAAPSQPAARPQQPPVVRADVDLERLVLALADAHDQPSRLHLSEDQWEALHRLRARHGLE